MDASIDHWGASVDAERFLSAIEAALFCESDLRRLISIGLCHCDTNGRFARMVRDVVRWQAELPWRTVRERILQEHGDPCSLHVLPNLGFVVLGLLEGNGDFAATVVAALNCGYDTDCTAATAGAIIGGVLGASGLPARFREAVPPIYAISGWMRGFPRQGRIDDLTAATCAMGARASRELGTGVAFDRVPTMPRAPLAVEPQPARLAPVRACGRATWRIVGPFWGTWEARRACDGDHGDSPAVAAMPSMAYITHLVDGFADDQLDPAVVADPHGDIGLARSWVRDAEDDRLPLAGIPGCDIPCSLYAASSFTCAQAHRAWLMLGSSGPLRAWLNGIEVHRSDSYQPLTPTTFARRIELAAGRNTLVLKMARTSQEFAAYAAFKNDRGRHWHQEFFDLDVSWV